MALVAVKTKEDQKEFQSILSRGWKENDWEQYDVKGRNYLYKDRKGNSFATVTFLDYNPGQKSFVNHIFCFGHIEPIKSNLQYTVEMDHFTVLRERRGMKTMLFCAKETATEIFKNEDIKYCVAIMQPRFFRTLKKLLGRIMVPVSDPIYHKEDDCYFIPFYFDVAVAKRSFKFLKLISV